MNAETLISKTIEQIDAACDRCPEDVTLYFSVNEGYEDVNWMTDVAEYAARTAVEKRRPYIDIVASDGEVFETVEIDFSELDDDECK